MRLVADATRLRAATGWTPGARPGGGPRAHHRVLPRPGEPRPLQDRHLQHLTARHRPAHRRRHRRHCRGVSMHAVILAGGKGVRLRPYTTALPKPLVPIGDQHAILEIVLRQLAAAGFTSCTLAIGHLGHIIRAYVGDGSPVGPARRLRHRGQPARHHGPAAHHAGPAARALPRHERRRPHRPRLRRRPATAPARPARR